MAPSRRRRGVGTDIGRWRASAHSKRLRLSTNTRLDAGQRSQVLAEVLAEVQGRFFNHRVGKDRHFAADHHEVVRGSETLSRADRSAEI
jgi:hypothetical protein